MYVHNIITQPIDKSPLRPFVRARERVCACASVCACARFALTEGGKFPMYSSHFYPSE